MTVANVSINSSDISFLSIGNAITWIMSWVAAVGIYRKNRVGKNQLSDHESQPVERLSNRQLAFDTGADKTNNGGECFALSTSSSGLAFKLKMEMLEESLEGVYQQLEEITKGKESEKLAQEALELQHRETRRRLVTLEKKKH